MLKYCLILSMLFAGCKTTTFYVVRHAEKEVQTMSADVPLSPAGQQRAQALKDRLDGKVSRLFSTNFLRTRSTAAPLVVAGSRKLELYDPRDTGFVRRLKAIQQKGILIVGHSNTVDDLVNGLLGRQELTDLPETQYGDLFIITRRGGQYRFSRSRYGE